MSDAVDRAFEQALIRDMGGEDPVESLKLVHVAGRAFTTAERVKQSMFLENERWQAEQDEMFSKNISDKSQRWLDAKEVHDILITSYKNKLKLLGKIGDPRGFSE